MVSGAKTKDYAEAVTAARLAGQKIALRTKPASITPATPTHTAVAHTPVAHTGGTDIVKAIQDLSAITRDGNAPVVEALDRLSATTRDGIAGTVQTLEQLSAANRDGNTDTIAALDRLRTTTRDGNEQVVASLGELKATLVNAHNTTITLLKEISASMAGFKAGITALEQIRNSTRKTSHEMRSLTDTVSRMYRILVPMVEVGENSDHSMVDVDDEGEVLAPTAPSVD